MDETQQQLLEDRAGEIASMIISLASMHLSREQACIEGWRVALKMAEEYKSDFTYRYIVSYAREVYRYAYSIVEQKWQELDELRAEEIFHPKKRDWWTL